MVNELGVYNKTVSILGETKSEENTRIFAKKSLSFHMWWTQHTIRIHVLHEVPVGDPAKEYPNFSFFHPVMLSALGSHHTPTIPLRKEVVGERKSLNVSLI